MKPFLQLFDKIDSDEDSALTLEQCEALVGELVERWEEWTESEQEAAGREVLEKFRSR